MNNNLPSARTANCQLPTANLTKGVPQAGDFHFTCPRCGTINQLRLDAKYPYCTGRLNNDLCGYTLTPEERTMVRGGHPARKNKKHITGLFLREAATIKFCSYNTILNNLKSFNLVPDSHPTRIILDETFLRWKPTRTRCGKKRRL